MVIIVVVGNIINRRLLYVPEENYAMLLYGEVCLPLPFPR
jgi:hypothetical protein